MSGAVLWAVLSIALLSSNAAEAPGKGQETTGNRTAILNAARDVMRDSHFCALITIAEDGQPLARAMEPFEPTEDFHVWLGTNARTHKIDQIRNDPRVTLYYFDPKSPGYVTILGSARIVDDPDARQKYWRKSWEAFYEDGNRGSDYILIEVSAKTIQVVSYSHGIASAPQTWGAATVTFP